MPIMQVKQRHKRVPCFPIRLDHNGPPLPPEPLFMPCVVHGKLPIKSSIKRNVFAHRHSVMPIRPFSQKGARPVPRQGRIIIFAPTRGIYFS